MRRPTAFAVLALLALALAAGCAGGPTRVSAMERSAISLAVSGVIKAFNAAVAAADTAAIDGLYSEDAVLLPAYQPRVDGRQAIHAWWREGLAAPGLRIVLVPGSTSVAEAGDMATVVGTYDYVAAGPDGKAVHEAGKFVTVMKPVGSSWRIALEMWNTDAPPPAPGR